MAEDQSNSRIAVVTGASAGIGEAIARDFAADGARLVLNARREDKLHAVCRSINDEFGGEDRGSSVCVAGDAADAAVVDAVLDRAVDHYGREADLVVVNAGRGLAGSVLSSDVDQWEEMVRTNLLGAALLIRAAGNRMAHDAASEDWPGRRRDLVVIGSNVGRHISPFSSMYGATKFAVNSLAEAARRELGPKGVRVTLIEPGIVRSEFQEAAGYDPEVFGEFMAKVGPVLEPSDIARTISFVVNQPPAVHLCDILIRPTRQEYP